MHFIHVYQVPTPGSARQSEASFYPDDPSVGSADSRANSADVNAVLVCSEREREREREQWLLARFHAS